jgi:hypothetical protein
MDRLELSRKLQELQDNVLVLHSELVALERRINHDPQKTKG